jgi:MinD-like ATPase involved in chromosome partitioning or flagellar assembly
MKKLNLVVADQDITYITFVTNYIHNSEYSKRFIVKSFTKVDVLQQYINTKPAIDILLISEDFEVNSLESSITTLKLSQQNDEESGNLLFKYQSVSTILQKAIGNCEEGKPSKGLPVESEGTNIISFYSAVGGAGKTVTAINLSKQLSHSGNKVFYLNLELINSTPIFFPSDPLRNSSDLLYLLKAKPAMVAAELHNLKKTDPFSEIDYFDFGMNGEEMRELTKEDVKLLVTCLRETNSYDYIFIDLDSSLEERVLGALESSDCIITLLTNDITAMTRTSMMMKQAKRLLNDKGFEFKLRFVLNKYLGNSGGEIQEEFIQLCNEQYQITFDSFLPYVPSWKLINSADALISSSTFNQEAVKMLGHILKIEVQHQ